MRSKVRLRRMWYTLVGLFTVMVTVTGVLLIYLVFAKVLEMATGISLPRWYKG